MSVCFLDIGKKEGELRLADDQGENERRTVRTATGLAGYSLLEILPYRYTGIGARSPMGVRFSRETRME
jgi:hypothetical protein